MNDAWFNLLADGDGWGSIIFVIVIIALSLISHVAKKIKEKAEVEQAERKVQEAKQRHDRQARAGGQPGSTDSVKSGRAKPIPAERSQVGPAPQGRPGPATPAEKAVAFLRRALTEQPGGAPHPPPVPKVQRQASAPRQRPPAPPARRVAQAQTKLGEGVLGEVRLAEKHLSAEEAQRSRRIGQVKHLQPGIVTTAAGPAGSVGEPRQRIMVDLSTQRTAMHGIIFSEILGPPKSLRTGPESWDL